MDVQLLEYMPDVVLLSDRGGTIRYANRTIVSLLGYEPSEIVGRPIEMLLPNRFRVRHALHLQDFFAAPRVRPMGLGLELAALRKNGEELAVDISLAPVQVGAETYVLAAMRDISERRKLEERERQLRAAQEEVRERDEILAIASHELRTPVGSMHLQAQLLKRLAVETANELSAIHSRTGAAAMELDGIQGRVVKLEKYSHRLGRLIEQLLDSAHVRHGGLPLRIEEADLSELARETVASLRDDVERSGSTLIVQAESPIPGRWDPIRIEQVIANLLLNAAKFGQGKPILVAVEADPDVARVRVEDQGPGIAAEDQERIFLQFERAVAVGGALGLGLGLYIARQIVLAHGGSLSVRSAVGSGSTFTVELPRVPLAAT